MVKHSNISFTITNRVTVATLPKVLPSGFADFSTSLRLTEPITVAVSNSLVVLSGAARKALKKVHAVENSSVLFVARDFTEEAQAVIKYSGAQIMRHTTFGWTDESYLAIRTRTPSA